MDKYLIETPHTDQNCHLVVNEVHAMGYLYNFDWGCGDGVHCGWAIIEAENEAEARMVVPSIIRKDARVIRLIRFDPDKVQALHHD